ncbi:MAG: FecR domain-containing protein [Verrucomicrobia bacterium]|nr:FecR domain-containing protein [Verrucomicrobiota bacterium]
MNPPYTDGDDTALRLAAARWTVQRDRGLSAAESVEFELWLAADPRHAAALRRSAGAWSLLDRLPESAAAPVVAAATRRRSFWRRTAVLGSLAAAAAVALVVLRLAMEPAAPAMPGLASAAPRQLTLSDGTVVQLNTGGEVVEQFTAAERRVLLARGEAHFAVTKNAARPFVVHAGNVDVRAVGTAFNVHLQSAAVDVLVTEGTVQLGSSAEAARATAPLAPIPLLTPGQRAVVALAPVSPAASVVVTTASPDEIARTLAWQAPLLRLGGQTLAQLALEFERRSGQRVIFADPSLAELRVGGRFRADDAAGFTQLLATTLDLDVERAADGALVLRKKNSESR